MTVALEIAIQLRWLRMKRRLRSCATNPRAERDAARLGRVSSKAGRGRLCRSPRLAA